MPAETRFTNARIVLAGEVVTGSLKISGETIAAIDLGAMTGGEDCDGDYLVPGLVELHTDHLENHYHPRPGVFWNATAALQAHDAQIAASGITTVFDAVRIGSDADMDYDLGAHVDVLIQAIRDAKRDRRLRAEHFVHLRCELATADALAHFEAHCERDAVRFVSLMDHTPGQRQFVTMDLYYAYYQGRSGRSDAEMQRFIAARIEDQRQYADTNRKGILAGAKAAGLTLASHDDATADHIAEARRDGIRVAEFPTTREAAKAARKAGMAILLGAPNIVRGGSHSGNISAADLAAEDLLDILSSDYIPFSLMHAAFDLTRRLPAITLPAAIARVTGNPAKAAGLEDRGEIAIGKRADLARVSVKNGIPIVRAVWRQGARIA